MAIITFMSDFGWKDPYVAAIKAKILSVSHNTTIVDISHEIEHFNIPHAAYVTKTIFKDFPIGTVHLICVNTPVDGDEKLVAVKLEEHYFVGVDNGFFSLLSEKQPTVVVELRKDDKYNPVFPEKSVLATAAVSLANGIPIYNLGVQIPQLAGMLMPQVRANKQQIWGRVVHVDGYGNLITNISKEIIDKLSEGRKVSVNFAREQLDVISDRYSSVESGDCVAVFNSNGWLEIAICNGNASQMLGLKYDSQIQVKFTEA
jgi:S-adenosylmethionine hydrolase